MAANTGPSGYDCNFITEPADALKCLICLSVAKDPRQHEECGRLFCKECIEMYGKDKPCPNCKITGSHFYVDHRSKRDISELKVKCDNFERKCEWVGTVSMLKKHVATCKFALLPCPKECKDDNNEVKNFLRKDLDQHLEKNCPNRDYTCTYCRKNGTYAHITGKHDKICPKKILPCPNAQEGCTDLVHRQSIDRHLATECKCTVVTCKYQSLGCTREMRRKDMTAHEEDNKLHLHMAIDMTVKLQEKTIKLERDLEGALATLKTGEVKFKFTDYQERIDKSKAVYSPSYYISPNGYYMAIQVYANGFGEVKGTHVSVFARILKGRYDAELKWPFIGKITFTLLNQLEDKNHHQRILDVTAAYNVQAGSAWGYPKFIPHSELGHDRVKNTQYLKDDTLYFRMSVEVADHKPWLE